MPKEYKSKKYEPTTQEPLAIYRDLKKLREPKGGSNPAGSEIKAIDLTEQEIEDIYRSRERHYDTLDCRDALETYLEAHKLAPTQDEFEDALDRIYTRYRHDYSWTLDDSMLLEEIAREICGEMFEQRKGGN